MSKGYKSDFIGAGFEIPLPTFRGDVETQVLQRGVLRDGRFSDHEHFTVVMNRLRRQPIYTAHNIDQALFVENVKGKKSWSIDTAVGEANQLDNLYYKDRKTPSGATVHNPYDRGHMVMRFNNVWGPTPEDADAAGEATFVYSNCALQHKNLNRDEWRALEMDIVRELSHDTNDRLSVFTGPIWGDLDRHVYIGPSDSARVPSGFFKVLCFQLPGDANVEDRLGVYAFAVFQDTEVLKDQKGSSTIKRDRNYQVTISELQDLTGINFGRRLHDRNPLFYHHNAPPEFTGPDRHERGVRSFPERIPLSGRRHLVDHQGATRHELDHPDQHQVSINAAMVDPKGGRRGTEWVSLLNVGSVPVDLDDWELTDQVGRGIVLEGVLPPGESVLFAGPDLKPILLANAGGDLVLYDRANCIVDHVIWSERQVEGSGRGRALRFE